jgi:hypothetical protein
MKNSNAASTDHIQGSCAGSCTARTHMFVHVCAHMCSVHIWRGKLQADLAEEAMLVRIGARGLRETSGDLEGKVTLCAALRLQPRTKACMSMNVK